ncbi:MAG: V-type ATPase 116kDa subunit family protein [Clostridiales bacterium]|nr:V-type ATPase 116kDa subunit family protein [Clostridiales bacterium]
MIEKMKFLKITGPKEDIDRVIKEYLKTYEVHIENAMTELSDVNDIVPYVDTYNVRETLQKSQETIEQLKQLDDINNEVKAMSVEDKKMSISESIDYLAKMHMLLEDLDTQKKERLEKMEAMKEKKKALLPFKDIDVSLSKLKENKFVLCQFGRIAIDYYEKMMKYVYDDMSVLFMECANIKGYVYGVYFAPSTYFMKADAIFSTLHFEDIKIPEEYTDCPAKILDDMDQQITTWENEILNYEEQMVDVLRKHAAGFIVAYDILKEYNDNASIRKLAACTKEEHEVYYILCGWMTKKDTEAFQKVIKEDSLVSCFVEDTTKNSKLVPPTKLKNPKIFKPFEMFIRMYGLPSYGEFDPTIFVALTYSFLFGMMYGDVGQGLCLVVGGFLLYKLKKQNLCAIMSLAGISSTIFGFMYGSIFGFEDIIEPIWTNPMKDTLTVLITAIAFGIALIVIAMIINIINGIRQKDVKKIFFETNGVAGLVFYGTVVGTAVLLATGHTIKAMALVIIMIVIPLLLIFFKEPLANLIEKKKQIIPGSKGMFIVENAFQLVEVLLSYMTNTISFVRVGAFALSHAGMMSVVLLLAGANSGHPNMIVIILGNLFVAGLEGLIVGIQVLRLEYYEMFSRFYSGAGREFKAKN